MWALDVRDQAYTAILTIQAELEPLRLSSTNEPTSGIWDGIEFPEELQIELASTWVRIAGAQIYARCRENMRPEDNPGTPCPGRNSETCDDVDGYTLDRWRLWKGILQEVVAGRWRQNVIEAAQVRSAMSSFYYAIDVRALFRLP